MPTPTAHGTPSTFFEPRDADALWKLVTTPHPLVGKAKHLREALVNADMVPRKCFWQGYGRSRSSANWVSCRN